MFCLVIPILTNIQPKMIPVQVNESSTDSVFSKDKSCQWFLRIPSVVLLGGRARAQNVISGPTGVTNYAKSRIGSPIDAFDLWFTTSMRQKIILHSNEEGKRQFGEKWTSIDSVTFDAYVGLLILSGVFKGRHESIESLWDSTMGRPIFCSTMSKKMFKLITVALRFDDKKTRSHKREKDKFAPIRDIFDVWVKNNQILYSPMFSVTVDEQFCTFRGKCPFRQFMPSKPARYGVKFWILCYSSICYIWNIISYLGKQPNMPPEKRQGERVVLELVKDLKGRNVTCDNFFTTYKLAYQLLKRNITVPSEQTKPFCPS